MAWRGGRSLLAAHLEKTFPISNQAVGSNVNAEVEALIDAPTGGEGVGADSSFDEHTPPRLRNRLTEES